MKGSMVQRRVNGVEENMQGALNQCDEWCSGVCRDETSVMEWTMTDCVEDCAEENLQGTLSQCDEWHSRV
jgi:hypothetical protein